MAASPRDIRRLALLALYQIDAAAREHPAGRPASAPGASDAVTEEDLAVIRASLDNLHSLAEEGLTFADLVDDDEFTDKDKDKAFAKACDAYRHRAEADAAAEALAPDWPARRQAAVDRAILRLAHHELTRTEASRGAIINEAVELAKAFSTEKSPGFINALLDKMGKASDAATPRRGDEGV